MIRIILALALTTSFYQMFCIGYIEALPNEVKDAMELAAAFLRGIEAEQAKRGSPKA